MLVKGDKIVLKEKMGVFENIGEVCEVIDATESGVVTFKFGNGMHMGCMSMGEFEKYFNKYEEQKQKNTVTAEDIDRIINESELRYDTQFGKCTIVICKLPNGFVITESSSNEEIGVNACLKRIRDKVWELESYKLQCELYEKNKADMDTNAEERICPSGGCDVCRKFECDRISDDIYSNCSSCAVCKDHGGCCKGCD